METFEKKLDNSKRTKCEIWTRAMGYCRPVANFNKGKKSEYYSRVCFCESKAVLKLSEEDVMSVAAE